MSQNGIQDREEIFSFHDEESGFDEAVTDKIRQLIEQQRDTVMASENVISYSHGEGWMSWQNGDENQTHEFEEHSHEEVIKFQDIIDHNISILPTYILRMVEGVHSEFMRMMYQTVHEATERTGNVVDAKQYASSADAFLESLRKIEFGVDRDGEVSRPQFHLSPEAHKKLVSDAKAQGAEFKRRVEEITAAKEKAALEREAERKARFTKPANEQ